MLNAEPADGGVPVLMEVHCCYHQAMRWTNAERRILRGLRTPAHIQQFLDELDFEPKGGASSPRKVMRTGKAQCYSGSLFACAALRELGYPPRMMYIDAVADDVHCVAVYEKDGRWGAVSKSRFTMLRGREAIYPYLALGLTYFDGYFNDYNKRTMRSFTVPVELEPFEPRGWRFSEGPLLYIDRALEQAPKAWALPRRLVREVSDVSENLFLAGTQEANAGLSRLG